MNSFLSLQPQCLKTTFFKREVTLKVSEIYGEVLLLQLSVFHVKQSLLLLFLLLLLYFLIIIMLCFRDINCAVKVMVKFVSSKEMLQNTEEFVQKGTYKTVCHGTSVNVICYMAQQRK